MGTGRDARACTDAQMGNGASEFVGIDLSPRFRLPVPMPLTRGLAKGGLWPSSGQVPVLSIQECHHTLWLPIAHGSFGVGPLERDHMACED